MKKSIIFLIAIVMVMIGACVCATESLETNEEIVTLDDYEDYENLTSAGEYSISQEELKEAYSEYKTELSKYYEEYSRPDVLKAKVINAGDVEVNYETDYYSVYENKTQKIEVEVIEGEKRGTSYELTYYLTADAFNNIEVPKVNSGDIVYVSFDKETGDISVGGVGANVERSIGLAILAIVTAVLICIYGRSKGIFVFLIVALIIATVGLIYIEQIFEGTNAIIMSAIVGIILAVVSLIAKVGINKNTLVSAITICVVIAMIILITFAVDYFIKNKGTTFEIAFVAENIFKGNINFHELFLGSIILMLSIILPSVAKKVIDECKNNESTKYSDLIVSCKNCASSAIENVAIILTVLIVPKLLLLYAYKYKFEEIINSDIIVSEVIRLCMMIIAIVVFVPIMVYVYKIVNKEIQEEKE